MEDELRNTEPRPDRSRWSITSRAVLFRNKWHEYRKDTGRTDHDQPYEYYYVHREHSAGILALTHEQELIFVRQYRYLLHEDSLELPGGGCHGSIKPEETARIELKEETGYEAGSCEYLCALPVAVGHSTDRMSVYIARDCKRAGEPTHESSELGMQVVLLSVAEAYRLAETGGIIDPLTLAALMRARAQLLK